MDRKAFPPKKLLVILLCNLSNVLNNSEDDALKSHRKKIINAR